MVNIKKITFKEDEISDEPFVAKEPYLGEIIKNDVIRAKKLNSPIFYVSKFHKRKCSHSTSKTKKNLIKKLIQEDYFLLKNKIKNNSKSNLSFQKDKVKFKNNSKIKIIREQNKVLDNMKTREKEEIISLNNLNLNEGGTIPSLSEISKEDENLFLKKKTTNRNFRLFDKDVVIKKLMSNFLKFLKLILEKFINDNKLESIYEIKKKNFEENFSNEQKCKTFLISKKIKDFLLKKKCSNSQKNNIYNNKMISFDYDALLETKLIDIYQNAFLSSSFLVKYIFPKIKKDHDHSYFMHFNKFLLKILV